MIGPKLAPIFAVPKRWTMNSPSRIPDDTGTTHSPRAGLISESPSTAAMTEIAGVIIPSP